MHLLSFIETLGNDSADIALSCDVYLLEWLVLLDVFLDLFSLLLDTRSGW